MPHSTLGPVFVGLRLGLHALVVGLAAFAVTRAFVEHAPHPGWVLGVGVAFVVVYLAGAWMSRGAATPERRTVSLGWVVALTLMWALLVWLIPAGAYLVFPLFFLYLHLLPGALGVAAVCASTALAITALGLHQGFTVGGVTGPVVGAAVAIMIGLAYRALIREAQERERLLTDLAATRVRLAETEREQGALLERARLGREIHDTVAQGLSSIQMLLRAAERDAREPGAGYLRLARETAADSLADIRQIIHELTPSHLDDGLAAALRRLGEDQQRRSGVRVEVVVDPDAAALDLPMTTQTALLRIAQGALANVVEHAAATRARVTLAAPPGRVSLCVHDDGRGFELSRGRALVSSGDSFGLRAMQERIEQLGGDLELVSALGGGTSVRATLSLMPLGEREADAEAGTEPEEEAALRAGVAP